MQTDFKIEMAKRTNEELIQILTIEKDNYLPDALSAANTEFEKRNLQNEKINSIVKELSKKKELDDIKSNEPLDSGIKAATFLFPVIITMFLSGYYKAEGYNRKAKDLVVWTLYGFCFYIIIILIAVLV